MENQKKHNMEEVFGQMVNDDSVVEYNVTIPVTIPTMGGYTFDSLKRELTEFALQLVMSPPKKQFKRRRNTIHNDFYGLRR